MQFFEGKGVVIFSFNKAINKMDRWNYLDSAGFLVSIIFSTAQPSSTVFSLMVCEFNYSDEYEKKRAQKFYLPLEKFEDLKKSKVFTLLCFDERWNLKIFISWCAYELKKIVPSFSPLKHGEIWGKNFNFPPPVFSLFSF